MYFTNYGEVKNAKEALGLILSRIFSAVKKFSVKSQKILKPHFFGKKQKKICAYFYMQLAFASYLKNFFMLAYMPGALHTMVYIGLQMISLKQAFFTYFLNPSLRSTSIV